MHRHFGHFVSYKHFNGGSVCVVNVVSLCLIQLDQLLVLHYLGSMVDVAAFYLLQFDRSTCTELGAVSTYLCRAAYIFI